MTKYKLYIALVITVLLLSSQALVIIRQQQKFVSTPPDLERIISVCPPHWHLLNGSSTPEYAGESAIQEYDMVISRTYQSENGEQVQILMTWSRDGIRRAGHLQQVCYTASGMSVAKTQRTQVSIRSKKLDVTTFVAKGYSGLVEDVAYWRITGGRLEENITSGLSYYYLIPHRIDKLKRLIRMAYGEMPYNIMVRVSCVRSQTDKSSEVYLIFLKNYLENLVLSDLKLLTGL